MQCSRVEQPGGSQEDAVDSSESGQSDEDWYGPGERTEELVGEQDGNSFTTAFQHFLWRQSRVEGYVGQDVDYGDQGAGDGDGQRQVSGKQNKL